MDEKETEKLSLSKLVIVIDPGHGHTMGRTGTVAWKYSHMIKNEKGEIKRNKAGEAVIQTSTFRTIPDYVYSNKDACIKWQTKLSGSDGYCKTWNEREIVFEVAELMKPKLEEAGYEVYMTRTKKILSGSDNDANLISRNMFSNEKNADYFISIHVNGHDYGSNIWKRGAFYMYKKQDDIENINRSKQLGMSLVKHLKTYNNDKTDFIPVITDAAIQQDDLLVLSSDKTKGNKAKYKSLVEIGTYTNPKDAAILFDNKDVMKVTVAEQLVKGLLEHITDYFSY
jgi:N-acetylmuramoyl-L-alanine amidase